MHQMSKADDLGLVSHLHIDLNSLKTYHEKRMQDEEI